MGEYLQRHFETAFSSGNVSLFYYLHDYQVFDLQLAAVIAKIQATSGLLTNL